MSQKRFGVLSGMTEALDHSFYLFLQQDSACVWLMARLIREEEDFGQDLLIKHFGGFIWGLAEQKPKDDSYASFFGDQQQIEWDG